MFRTLFTQTAVFATVFHLTSDAALAWPPAAEGDALVDRIAARASALVSGRIEYHLTSGTNKNRHEGDYTLSLMGDSWARHSPEVPDYRINHLGMTLLYLQGAPVNGGEPYREAIVSNIEAIDRHRPCPPYFAGTLWYKESTKFIEAHRGQETTRAGDTIAGKATQIVEWRIDKKNLGAFGSYTSAMRNGGILRLHAAPDLEYALPLVEYLALDGTPQMVFESQDFFESAPGLFLPRHCGSRNIAWKGGHYVNYDITKAELINEEVPEDDFKCELPPGTLVDDQRNPDHKIVFRVGEIPLVPDDLAGIIETSGRRGAPWLRAAVVGLCVGLAFVAALVMVRRLRGAKTSS